MLLRRHVILHSLAWSAACCVPLPAAAQAAFPSRPIRLVVPNAAGGAADLTARTVGQRISENLGQPVVAGATVTAEIIRQGRTRSITVFKKHRRKNYRRTRGHRQGFTQLRVTGIETK